MNMLPDTQTARKQTVRAASRTASVLRKGNGKSLGMPPDFQTYSIDPLERNLPFVGHTTVH